MKLLKQLWRSSSLSSRRVVTHNVETICQNPQIISCFSSIETKTDRSYYMGLNDLLMHCNCAYVSPSRFHVSAEKKPPRSTWPSTLCSVLSLLLVSDHWWRQISFKLACFKLHILLCEGLYWWLLVSGFIHVLVYLFEFNTWRQLSQTRRQCRRGKLFCKQFQVWSPAQLLLQSDTFRPTHGS